MKSSSKKLRKTRPSVLPTRIVAFNWFSQFARMHDYLLYHWSAEINSEQQFFFASVFLLVVSGIPRQRAYFFFIHAQYRDLDNNILAVRIHPRDESNRRSLLPLTDSTLAILYAWKARAHHTDSTDYIFLPTSTGHNFRKRKLNKIFNHVYQEFAESYSEFTGDKAIPLNMLPHMHGHALFLGAYEPCILNILSSLTYPTSSPANQFPSLSRGPRVSFGMAKRNRQHISTIVTPLIHEPSKDDDCAQKFKVVCQDLIIRIGKITKVRVTPSNEDEIRRIFTDCRKQADNFILSTSTLHLALDWLEEKYCNQHKLTLRSLQDYLGRIFLKGFFSHPFASNLTLWAPEDFDELIHQRLDQADKLRELTPVTKQNILKTFYAVTRYASKHRYCEPLSTVYKMGEWAGGSGRPNIVGLIEFDRFIDYRMEHGTRFNQQLSVAAILNCYAMLRSSECVGLTLKDVYCDGNEVIVWIQGGKSKAARRTIYLHLLAPPEIVGYVRQVVQARRSEFQNPDLSSTFLFGPEESPRQYKPCRFTERLIRILNNEFGDVFDAHCLRHSGASWLLLRWYAARYPEFFTDYPESNHYLFSQAGRESMARYCTLGRHSRIPDEEPSDIIRLIKLIGHATTDTFFISYIHSFHVILQEVVDRMNKSINVRRLSNKIVANLVPRMRHSVSQNKLVDHTFGAVARFLVEHDRNH